MLTRRQFLTRSLQGASLLALSSRRAAVRRPHRPRRRAGQGQHPRRRRNDRRQRRPEHRHPLRRRPVPQGPADAAADQGPGRQGQRPHRPAPRHARASSHAGTQGELAVVQGVGYPNPDRSHFESMDIWQSADPKRQTPTRLARPQRRRTSSNRTGGVPIMHIGPDGLPLALQGAPGGVVSLNNQNCRSTSRPRRRRARATERPAASCSKTWRHRRRRDGDDDLASVRPAPASADADRRWTAAGVARRAELAVQRRLTAAEPAAEAAADRAAHPEGLRHAHLLRQPSTASTRTPTRRPAHATLLAEIGRRHQRLLRIPARRPATTSACG